MNRKGIAKRRMSIVATMVLILSMLVQLQAPIVMATQQDPEETGLFPWPVATSTVMPYRPAPQLTTTQNPPDFSWPHIEYADQYQLQVSRTKTFEEIAYEKDELDINVYNFPCVFDEGTWFWRVRYHKIEGWSEWTTPSKFRITKDAVPFPVPPVEAIRAEIPTSHPRIWTTLETLADFRDLALTSGESTYQLKLEAVNNNMATPLPAEPTVANPRDGMTFAGRMHDAAFVYLVSGDLQYGERAKEMLLHIASWDPDGATGYSVNDQVHRDIALKSAVVYDWIYSLLTEAEKQTVKQMIKSRTETIMTIVGGTNLPITEFPQNSHGWTAFGMVGVISIAMMNELAEASDWFNTVVPSYINILPPWGGEDGGWAQGTGYWRVSSFFNKDLMDALLYATDFNLYDKAFSRHEGNYPLYMFPHGSPRGVFGDDSEIKPSGYNVSMLRRLADMYDDPVMQWGSQAVGDDPLGVTYDYYYGDNSLQAIPPVELPKAAWFEDIGTVAMHSELYDPERISMYFKSSPYGSYNHSHADQNSFIINAFGESLAVDSGYYDWYNSDHHAGYSWQSYAHNTITVDGRQGQPINDIDADGTITGFVTHSSFDATSGDATAAYKGALDNAQRSVIYVRPDLFVIIDQLRSADAEGSNFEYQLHADDALDIDVDGRGASIAKGKAEMRVQFHSPGQLTTTFTDQFLNLQGLEVRPQGRFIAKQDQQHATFITEKTSETTIVSTLQPYRRGDAAQPIVSVDYGSYLKLTMVDGTVVYVRMTESGEVDTGDVVFDGAAAAINPNGSVLLVSGTKLIIDEIERVISDEVITIAYDNNDLSVSNIEEASIEIYVPNFKKLYDMDGNKIKTCCNNQGLENYGVEWSKGTNLLQLSVEHGDHLFKLNKHSKAETLPDVQLEMELSGVIDEITLSASKDLYGREIAWGELDVAEGFYRVAQAPEGFLFVQYGKPEFIYLKEETPIMVLGDLSRLKLEPVDFGTPVETVLYTNYDLLRFNSDVWKEAESFSANGGGDVSTYTTRSFLSGGVGVGDWAAPGQWIRWNVNVTEPGEYDLILKYVAGFGLQPGETTSRYVEINGDGYYFEASPTVDYGTVPENWRGLRVELEKPLQPGLNEIAIYSTFGPMNLDWIGLAESKEDVTPPDAPGNLSVVSVGNTVADIAWDAANDDIGIHSYEIFVDGVAYASVAHDSTTYTMSSLVPGGIYQVSVRAVDTSGNFSDESNLVVIESTDTIPPEWGVDAAIESEFVLPTMARLSWDGVEAENEGALTYKLYEEGVSGRELIATTTNPTYDVIGLEASTTYTFAVEAVDASGNISIDGPTGSVTTPATITVNGYFDLFDEQSIGTLVTGTNGYTVVSAVDAPVSIEDISENGNGNKALQLHDGRYDINNEFEFMPYVSKLATTPLSGRVTFETKFKFQPLNHPSGNYDITVLSGNTVAAKLTGASSGGFFYWDVVNGSNSPHMIPSGSPLFKLPLDEWVKVRFDLDTDTKTYDLTIQADALKAYTGAVAAPAILDTDTGTFRIEDITFYNNNTSLTSIDGAFFDATRYTGNYLFDYSFLYENEVVDTIPPEWGVDAAIESEFVLPTMARLSWDGVEAENEGALTYKLYVEGVSGRELIATTTNPTYDVIGLVASTTYTFAVEAVDASGNISIDGPTGSVTTPATITANGYFDLFDEQSIGTLVTGTNGYTVVSAVDAPVSIEDISENGNGNKALQLHDGRYDINNEFEFMPYVSKLATTPLSGRVTFETKFKFQPLNHPSGNYDITVLSGNTVAAKLTGASSGGFFYWDVVNGSNSPHMIPSGSPLFKLPLDEWVKVRFDLDTDTKTYDLTIQADALKAYTGAVAAPATLDTETGTYRVTDITFYNNNTTLTTIDGAFFDATRYTGIYQFDYSFLYENP
ncbi:DUF4962 domain-containing protein [Paenibacillus sp. J5C_2022]|uniref:DUF4962 domain-containing protein n=1 Tax=Paenibacillus sp. J5C2022 TaxID=2977129 RepID=UPI0021D02AB1|nr:DUF4962 domain-containing protein [Paenibacillus sp. J5C2022]MCU6712574.1 DUF4962 domain-containing protein [Paenibacillus sp. J5C2022]